MTLAASFLFGILWMTSPPTADAAPMPALWQSTASQEAQSQGTAAQQASPEVMQSTSASTPAQNPVKRRKKKVASGCNNTAATSTTAQSSASSNSTSPGNAGQAPDAANPAKDCPPTKIVVRQGGTSEPSIQLAGGSSASQENQAKDNVAQMLDSTEGNLKKLSERDLTATEKDTVAQIHEFMDQSKAAVASGDAERARTLAWKAQTLSDDLVNPKK